jgi:hypothetical protein
MPSDFPRSPKLLKGALAVYKSQTPGPPPQVIVFQFNPDQLKRKLEKRAPEQKKGNVGASKEDVLRAQGPPEETIDLAVELDAADQLAEPSNNQSAVENGLLPALATLEMLLYPSTARVLENQALAGGGKAQISPADLPLTLLVWSKSRVVPVLLTSFSVTEEAFDQALNPIRAKVELGMKVLTYMELKPDSIGYQAYLSFQRQKETLAQQHQSDSEDSRTVSGFLPSGGS